MPRYIDAEKAFEVIKNLLYETAINNAGVNEAVDVICQDFAENRLATWLDEVPSVELSEGVKWIPVSERLPEEERYVLITKEPLKINGYEQEVIKAKRSTDPRSGKIEWWSPELGTLKNKAVLAWMPMPEPYMGGGENDGR